MTHPDLILLHPPSVYKFRELPIFHGPVSDVVPSSSIFEIYPIGFLTISAYLHKHGISVRIINLANKMLGDAAFDPERLIAKLRPVAFGIDLHWLPHVDGALTLAESLKRHHPDIPVILGGLSASYYHDEIMHDYPFVDFILCGDSTEEPLRLLMHAIRSGKGYEAIPNLVWRYGEGAVVTNELSHRPANLDYLQFDYAHLIRMALKYRDLSGYMPFQGWLAHPVTAVFTCRGCIDDCASCGGSLSGFQRTCRRGAPSFRSPDLLADDIRKIAGYTGAPIMVVGDLLQAGEEYAERFLQCLKSSRIKNELAIEFFHPPPETFVKKVADAVANFNVELSPESHDPRVRGAFGRSYGNAELESAIEASIRHGCKRIDIFFMVGLPYQDYSSVMETVRYCGVLLKRYGGGKLLPMIAPLAPFIDPGSRIFEEPESFGYRIFYRTLKEHRQAMLMPSWKYTLNYETEWMTRDDIVNATYDGAMLLIDLKTEYGIIDWGRGAELKGHIRRAKELINRLDELDDPRELDTALRTEIFALNRSASLCDKHELEWPLKGWRLNIMSAVKMLFGSFLH